MIQQRLGTPPISRSFVCARFQVLDNISHTGVNSPRACLCQYLHCRAKGNQTKSPWQGSHTSFAAKRFCIFNATKGETTWLKILNLAGDYQFKQIYNISHTCVTTHRARICTAMPREIKPSSRGRETRLTLHQTRSLFFKMPPRETTW